MILTVTVYLCLFGILLRYIFFCGILSGKSSDILSGGWPGSTDWARELAVEVGLCPLDQELTRRRVKRRRSKIWQLTTPPGRWGKKDHQYSTPGILWAQSRLALQNPSTTKRFRIWTKRLLVAARPHLRSQRAQSCTMDDQPKPPVSPSGWPFQKGAKIPQLEPGPMQLWVTKDRPTWQIVGWTRRMNVGWWHGWMNHLKNNAAEQREEILLSSPFAICAGSLNVANQFEGQHATYQWGPIGHKAVPKWME